MSSVAQVLRQAESLKASLVENGKNAPEGGKGSLEGGKNIPDLWVTRQKLEDVYKGLLIMDLECALDKKVEQDLWNHAFKNQITALQAQVKERQNPKKAEVQANLNLFLETASGFFLQFLQLICTTFNLDLPFRRKSSAFGVMKEKSQLGAKITPPNRTSCLYICQYCLVHLGDIARYRQQGEQAQTYYRHAVNLSPQNGQPYNQLAILEVNRNNKLSSVFYYVRSLAVRHPFPVAATNLEKFYAKLIKDTSEFKGKMAQTEFVNAFLQFQALLHLAADFQRASYLCSRILACLPAHLISQTFSASVLVQCVAITIFTLNHIRHVPSGGEAGLSGSPKGEYRIGEKSWRQETKVEVTLSSDEQKGLDIILGFTASVLELLIQHTPSLPAKARESPTLPAVQVLLDWLRHSADVVMLTPFAASGIWGFLAKMLNTVQLFEDGKPDLDLTKYDDVPLPEDTELRCFQPIEKAHSKYSFSRIPVEGFPRGVEELVRCWRLVSQGKAIAEEFPQLKMMAVQQNNPLRISFSGPLSGKNSEVLSSSVERRAKQNVAMQAIMKHGQPNQSDAGRVSAAEGVSAGDQGSPKYLLGTATSEPQFMKHGAGGAPGRLQSSPQLSPRFSRNNASPQTSAGGSPGVPGHDGSSPGAASGSRVASPVPPSPSQQQQQQQQQSQSSPPQIQSRKQPRETQPGHLPQQQQPASSPSVVVAQSGGGSGGVLYAPPPPYPPHSSSAPSSSSSPASPSSRGQVSLQPQHQGYSGAGGNLSYQAPAGKSPPHDHHLGQGHHPHHRSQGQAYQGQGQSSGVAPGNLHSPYLAMGGGGGERYHLPAGVKSSPPSQAANRPPGAKEVPPRMQQQGSSSQSFSSKSGQGQGQPAESSGARLNQEMLSALRLASQISQQQQADAGLHLSSAPHSEQPQPAMVRSPNQLPGGQLPGGPPADPGLAKVTGLRGVKGGIVRPVATHPSQPQFHPHGAAVAGSVPPSYHPAPLSQQGKPSPAMNYPTQAHAHPGMSVPPDVHMHPAFPSAPAQLAPRPRLPPPPQAMGAPPLPPPPPRHEMGVGSNPGLHPHPHPRHRLPAPPIPMPGQPQHLPGGPPPPSYAAGLMAALYAEEGSGMARADLVRSYQALSPLTIQPPKSSPPDTRISTSFQGHAEGTPKPEKQRGVVPEKREVEPVVHRVSMPIGQPGGEYSLFASSSPWSMPLNTSSDSKSIASSPFSSKDSSMRNSPVVGFDLQQGPYDNPARHKGTQGEAWIMQGQGHDDPQGRGQPEQVMANMPSMWVEPQTPLERLLEQQRMQRQTDPH